VLVAVLLLLAGLVTVRVLVGSRARRAEAQIAAVDRAVAAEAESGVRRFERYLEVGGRGPHELDGPTLTRYLRQRYGARIPSSVETWRVELEDGLVVVGGLVDLDTYLGEMGMERPPALAGLGAQVLPFSFRGTLSSENGQGVFEVCGVSLLGLPLPLELVDRVGNPSGRNGGSVLVQRFRLPDGIRRAALDGDRMVIHGQDS